MRLVLTINVTYRPHGVTLDDLVRTLGRAAEHLYDNGLLFGSTNAEVIRCHHDVRRLDVDDAPPSPESEYTSDKHRIWEALDTLCCTSAVHTDTLRQVIGAATSRSQDVDRSIDQLRCEVAELRQDLNRSGDDLRTLTGRVENLEANH